MSAGRPPSSSSSSSRGPVLFGPRGGPGAGQPGEKARDFKGTLKRLAAYLRPFWGKIGIVLIFALASTLFTIVSPRILGNVTNTIVSGYSQGRLYDQVMSELPAGTELPPGTTGADLIAQAGPGALEGIPESQRQAIAEMDLSVRHGIDFAAVRRTMELLIALYLISAVFSYAQAWIMAGVSQRVTYDLREELSTKIDRLPLSYFDARTHGEILSRVTNDVETISQTLNQSLMQIVTSVTMLVGILIMMLSISWQLTLVALVVLPVSMLLIRMITKRSQPYFVQQQVSLGELNGHVEEMFSGHTVIKAFGAEQKSVETFRAINSKLHGSAWRSQFFSGLMFPVMMFVGNLGYVGVAVLGGWLAIQGSLRIGDIQAFLQYLNQFNQPISQAASIANVMQSTAAAAERVFEFLDEATETPDPVSPIHPGTVEGAVDFEHVVFGYLPDQTIIKDLSTKVRPGQRVAIVGPTGAGKTTIVNLLMRFYDPDSGTICIDGNPTEAMTRADVRSQFAMVLQESWLFNGTIEENIAYGREGATSEEVRAAAVAAHADHFIRALPGGYDMELTEDADNISAGEMQLMTIARAMLADAPMLIFDEATSSVDTRTEALIQKAMAAMMQGRTSFVIAHRLSTIRNADLILVMKDGNVIEQGTHDELMAQNGFYAELYLSQFTAPLEVAG